MIGWKRILVEKLLYFGTNPESLKLLYFGTDGVLKEQLHMFFNHHDISWVHMSSGNYTTATS